MGRVVVGTAERWQPSSIGRSVGFLLFLLSVSISPRWLSLAEALTLTESALKATLTDDKIKSNDKLTASGDFHLDTSSDGANPATESVTLTVGPFSQTVLPGSFSQKDTLRKTTWTFKGAKPGLTKFIITRNQTRTGEKWTFNAAGAGLSLASATTNPLTVRVQIGNDSGELSLFFVADETSKKAVFKFPGGNKDDPDGDGFVAKPKKGQAADCDPQDPAIFPGAPELCNATDDDCDTAVDEDFALSVPCTVGSGACTVSGTTKCALDESGTVCDATPGTGGTEVCNGVDDDCDGTADDGLGDLTCGVGSCVRTVTACLSGLPGQCIPGFPTAEVCGNGLDEDCDGADLSCVPVLPITISAPTNLSAFNTPIVQATGTTTTEATVVTCNGWQANLSAGDFAVNVPLSEGSNTITCVAQDAAGNVGSTSISVTLDSTPPRITIDSPNNGATLTAVSVSVTGIINDLVMGTVNDGEAQVSCNGVQAEVANRRFVVANISLTSGSNTITCTGTDKVGNVDSSRISVTFDTSAQNKINIVSGNNQTAEISTLLPQPFIVVLTENGTPAVGKVVVFKVLQNDGILSTATTNGRILAVMTDTNGQAQIHFTLGSWAGAGNNQVDAAATNFVGEARFNASALPGGANSIVVDSGNLQQGEVGKALPHPFVAAVIDQGSNRLGNVPVTFTVTEGGGNFNGQPSVTLPSDSDGRVSAVLTLGPIEGFDNNVVEATFPSNPGSPATYTASGKNVGDPANTTISGVVLDNSNMPIEGVTLRLEGTIIAVTSDEQGQFVLRSVPVGKVQLIADGTTTSRPGTWPTLEYELVTIAGRDNTIGMPIFLLPIDTTNGIVVDETHGGTITVPEIPGLSLTIEPGAATFPGGSKRGLVSVTLVHADKVPMVPNFGQQPRFIVTIQPPGVHFNPPAAFTIPNSDGLAPGQKTEMYSFDHDLGAFVSIGPATVSEDGLVIRSDPGVGIVKGGWHCGGNPAGSGTCEHECDDGNKCTDDKLAGGSCQHTPQTTAATKANMCESCNNGTPVPPQTEAQCCAAIGAAGGSVVCCNSNKTACADSSFNGASAGQMILRKCVLAHEREHFKHVDCPTGANECNTTQPPFKPGQDAGQGECDASKVEITCLQGENCGGNATCQASVDGRVTQMRQYGNTNKPGCFP